MKQQHLSERAIESATKMSTSVKRFYNTTHENYHHRIYYRNIYVSTYDKTPNKQPHIFLFNMKCIFHLHYSCMIDAVSYGHNFHLFKFLFSFPFGGTLDWVRYGISLRLDPRKRREKPLKTINIWI